MVQQTCQFEGLACCSVRVLSLLPSGLILDRPALLYTSIDDDQRSPTNDSPLLHMAPMSLMVYFLQHALVQVRWLIAASVHMAAVKRAQQRL